MSGPISKYNIPEATKSKHGLASPSLVSDVAALKAKVSSLSSSSGSGTSGSQSGGSSTLTITVTDGTNIIQATSIDVSSDFIASNEGGGTAGIQLQSIIKAGSIGDAADIPIITYDNTGRIINTSSVAIASTTMPATETVADAGAVGTSTLYALADHSHPMPGLATSSAPGFVQPDGATIVINGSNIGVGAIPRRWTATFFEPSATGIDTATQVIAPSGPSNASVTWTAKKAYIKCDTPSASATTAQVVYGASGNAVFGTGTAILSSALSISGTSNYESSTTAMASVTVSSGIPIAANWTAIGGTGAVLQIEFEATF